MEISVVIAGLVGAMGGAAAMVPLVLSANRRANGLLARMVEAETSGQVWQRQYGEASEAKSRADEAREVAQKALADAEKRLALAEAQAAQAERRMAEKLAEAEQRIADWKANEETALRHAQAAIQKVGADLSSKLLEDHKRENEAARKAAEELTEAKNKNVFEHLAQMQQAFAVLASQNAETTKQSQAMWRALSNPGSAGQIAEIGLANVLRDLGLAEGQDFDLQFAIDDSEGAIRPDALIYLPQDSLFVIDSKASKHLLALGEHEPGSDGEMAARANLRQSMRTHVKTLAGKDYVKKVEQHFRQKKGAAAVGHTLLVMYLPAENMLQHLTAIDPGFVAAAQAEGIVVLSPSGLQGLLYTAAKAIRLQRQLDGQAAILQQAEQLIDGAAKALKHVGAIGKGMKTAAEGLESFASSLNRFFLPRARAMAKHGVAMPKDLPLKLSAIEVRLAEDSLTIEGEAEENVAPLRVVAS